MKVVREIDHKKWSQFVYQHPKGTIFQTPEMYEIYKYTKNYEPISLAIVNEDNEIMGTLLSVIQREYDGMVGDFSTRAIIWGGPLIKDNDTKIFELILREYDKIAEKSAIYSQFRNLWDMSKFKTLFEQLGYSYVDHLNVIIDLNKSEEQLWKEVHSKERNRIRRALKVGTSVNELANISSIDTVYDILCEVYKNAKLPLADKSMFEMAFKQLNQQNNIMYFGAFNKNEIIGVLCMLAYRGTLYAWYRGSFRRYYDKCPNDLLPWEVMKWGREHGYTIFDFGGAGKPGKAYGVRDFKIKFGGTLVNYGRCEKVHQPTKLQMAKIGFKLWRKIQ